MIKNFLLILWLFLFITNSAYALDIVYPEKKEIDINAKSTFIIGNVNPHSELTINSEKVKIWQDGIFVHVVPLEYGKNKIEITENNDEKTETEIFNITRNKQSENKTESIQYTEYSPKIKIYTSTIKDRATVRSAPSTQAKRITELQMGTILYIAGEKGDFYKLNEKGESEYWIHKSNVDELAPDTKKYIAEISGSEKTEDKLYKYTKIHISHPVMYTFTQNGNKLKLTFYGANIINSEVENENTEFIFESNQFAGYDGKYEDGNFVLRMAKIPQRTNIKKALNGIRIFIDAGHGGDEKGSVGPTRIPEKDINLSIAKQLISMLKKEGAIVSYSRTEDKKVKLYDRVDKAINENAFISLSIHANALPDGKDPYKNHGTEVHYYNDNAKLLALIIKNNLASDLKLKDNGIHKSSFAMTRSTNPISVLVEIAYMINPDEYQKLKNPQFQKDAASSIKKSLEEFIFLLNK